MRVRTRRFLKVNEVRIPTKQAEQPTPLPIGDVEGVICVSGHLPVTPSRVRHHACRPFGNAKCSQFPEPGADSLPLFPQTHAEPTAYPCVEVCAMLFHRCQLEVPQPSPQIAVQSCDAFLHGH